MRVLFQPSSEKKKLSTEQKEKRRKWKENEETGASVVGKVRKAEGSLMEPSLVHPIHLVVD